MRSFPIFKTPGTGRIFFGGCLVSALILFASFGDMWLSYSAEDMDLENIMAPPSIVWLRNALTTERGRKILELNQSSSEKSEETRKLNREKAGKPHRPSQSGNVDKDQYWFLEQEMPEAGGGAKESSDPSPIATAGSDSKPHYFGTDKLGRDIVALVAEGSRNCLLPGLVSCIMALGFGIPLGLLSGYYGGWFSQAVRGMSGILLSLPRLVLILVVICALEPNVYYTMAVLGVTLIPRVSELLATRVRLLSNMGFVLAARESGLSDFKILYRHLFWYQNRAVFFIQFSLIMAESILVETTLSYLQFGTKPPDVSWGNIIEGSQMTFFSGVYWITFFPAVAIILAILGFFYLGDGLNARLAYNEGK